MGGVVDGRRGGGGRWEGFNKLKITRGRKEGLGRGARVHGRREGETEFSAMSQPLARSTGLFSIQCHAIAVACVCDYVVYIAQSASL